MAYRVLLNDGMDKEGIEMLREAGFEIDTQKRDLEGLIREVGNFDAITVRSSTKVTKEIIEAGYKGSLKIIGRAGVEADNVDTDAASTYGIPVSNAPHGNTNATAEHALGLIFALSRKLVQAHESLKKDGSWLRKQLEGAEVFGATLGIIGCGRIGQELSQKAIALGIKVIGYDQYLRRVESNYPNSRIEYMPKEQVLRQADYVSIHTGGKEIIIGAQELSLMKPTAFLINVSRGANVDEEALYEALLDKRIAGAGIDVYKEEPKKEGEKLENRLLSLENKNLIVTPHLGASTKKAQLETSKEMAGVIIDYFTRGTLSNPLNLIDTTTGVEVKEKVYPLFIHNKDVPGAYGRIGRLLGDHQINIGPTLSGKFILKDGTKTGGINTVFLVEQEPSQEVLQKLEKLDVVYRARI